MKAKLYVYLSQRKMKKRENIINEFKEKRGQNLNNSICILNRPVM